MVGALVEPGFRLGGELALRTRSLDAARAHLSNILTPHRLESVREAHMLDFQHRRATFGGIALHQIRYTAPVRLEVLEPPDFYLLQLTLVGCAAGLIDGETVVAPAGHFMVVNPGRPFTKLWEPDTEQLMLRIDQKILERALDPDVFRPSSKPPRFLPRAFAAAEVPALLGLLRTAGADLAGAGLLGLPSVGRRFADAIIQVMFNGLPHDQRTATLSPASSAAPRSVRRAEEFMLRNSHEDLSLADIAMAAGVPARTLHEAFRRFRNTSPVEYLRALRLQRARRMLEEGRPEVTVTSVAEECGLRHLGRFAQEYARRFGEAPSRTLRRARGQE
jgi:AraC-like DNA-binding protein